MMKHGTALPCLPWWFKDKSCLDLKPPWLNLLHCRLLWIKSLPSFLLRTTRRHRLGALLLHAALVQPEVNHSDSNAGTPSLGFLSSLRGYCSLGGAGHPCVLHQSYGGMENVVSAWRREGPSDQSHRSFSRVWQEKRSLSTGFRADCSDKWGENTVRQSNKTRNLLSGICRAITQK